MSLPANVGKVLFSHDEADAIGSPAATGVFPIIVQVKTVVERDLFPGLNLPPGNDPDMALVVLRLAIRAAAMIKEPGRIPRDIAIDVLGVTQGKDILVVVFAASK
jgi:hypothetical protein